MKLNRKNVISKLTIISTLVIFISILSMCVHLIPVYGSIQSLDPTIQGMDENTKVMDVNVKVSDIEISEYSNELEVGKTLNLSVTVLPADAIYSKLTYSTSDTAIISVSSAGVVKGISPGNAEITLSAGGVTKKITILVKVATISIKLNTNYLVLKKGDAFQIIGTAVPVQAKQTIVYKSADETIVNVTQEGKVTAKAIGNTTILATNGDMTNAVTVIVNSSNAVETALITNVEDTKNSISEPENNISKFEKSFIYMLTQSDQIEVTTQEYPLITTEMLKKLYESKKVIAIKGNQYTLILDGKDIVNYNNQLTTKVEVTKSEKGIELVLNDNQNLPGSVLLKMNSENDIQYNYLYLFNAVKDKYQMIKTDNLSNIKIDTAEKYLLTEQKINGISLSLFVIIVFILAIIILSGIYIGLKKKHWFW